MDGNCQYFCSWSFIANQLLWRDEHTPRVQSHPAFHPSKYFSIHVDGFHVVSNHQRTECYVISWNFRSCNDWKFTVHDSTAMGLLQFSSNINKCPYEWELVYVFYLCRNTASSIARLPSAFFPDILLHHFGITKLSVHSLYLARTTMFKGKGGAKKRGTNPPIAMSVVIPPESFKI